MNAPLMSFAAIGWAWLLGALAVAAWWPRERRLADDGLLVAAFGLWIGLAITATTFCAATLATGRPGILAGGAELALALVLGWRVTRRREVTLEPREEMTRGVTLSLAGWLVGIVFVQAAVVATVIAVRSYQAEPFGGWDAWAIWNMHARFFFHGGASWPELLRVPSIHWTHPDYPWVVSASIARVWTWIGSDAPWGAGIVSLAFAAATVALLVAIVDCVRGRVVAWIGGLALIGTPFFVTFHEHADVPLGCAMLAALAAIVLVARQPQARGGWWWLAGGCTGMAAWVKNEGLLFALVTAGVLALHTWRARTWRNAAGFVGGLALAALPLVAFKLVAGASNDLLEQPLGPRLAWLFDPRRHAIIGEWLARAAPRFGEWHVLPFVVMAAAFAAPGGRKLNGAERTLPAIVLLMLAGYYVVYLLSPHNLSEHLETSLVRLLLQLWPLVILAWCLTVPADPVAVRAAHGSARRAVFAAVNLALALGSVAVLSRQLAANQFDAARVAGGDVRVTLGAGWFGMERAERERWAWSEGTSTLVLHSAPAGAGRSVKLRFELRGLGRRAVIVRAADRELWRGIVGEEFVGVTLPPIVLQSGTTVLHFETDTPGVAEAPNADARKLTFAVYNLRIER